MAFLIEGALYHYFGRSIRRMMPKPDVVLKSTSSTTQILNSKSGSGSCARLPRLISLQTRRLTISRRRRFPRGNCTLASPLG